MDKEKLKILILGSSGQIGTELIDQLKNYSYQLTALSRSSKKNIQNKNINYINFDILNNENNKLEKLVAENDYIYHLAGDTSVMSELNQEINYHKSWIQPTHRILNSLVGTDKRFIYASSASVYGIDPILPVKEDSYEYPLTSYDLAKISCDNLIRYYKSFYNINCVSLRFSNVYGPETTIGKDSRRVINKILNNIHLNKEISIVSDGLYKRNYVHVYDSASMLIHAAQHITKTPAVVLACSRENFSFKEVIECLVKNYEKRFHNEKIQINYGLKEKFITDLRSFNGEPSKIFKDYEFKYSLDMGFRELVECIE